MGNTSMINYQWVHDWFLAYGVTLLQQPEPHTDAQIAQVADDLIRDMKISEVNGYAKPIVEDKK